MRSTTRALHVVLSIGTALLASASQANLLVNGSFEDGNFVNPGNATMSLPIGSTAISGWTTVGDTLAWIGTGNPWGLTANDGARFLDLTDLAAGAPFGGVTQAVATTPGASYLLSFDLGTESFNSPLYWWMTENAPRYGVRCTGSREHWHWECRPEAAGAHGHKMPRVKA
jgi:hypothetical protein